MNLDHFLTTDELAHLLRYPVRGVKRPHVEATRWATKRGIVPADGGSTKLWPKDAVTKALFRSRKPRLRRTA